MAPDFDFIAVIVAAIGAMMLGGLWYSPILFEQKWRHFTNTSADEDPRNPIVIYGVAFLLLTIGAAVFHAFLGPDPTPMFAVSVGFAAGLAWAAGSLWTSYIFEGRPKGLYLINGGFHTLQYTTYGLVFGLM